MREYSLKFTQSLGIEEIEQIRQSLSNPESLPVEDNRIEENKSFSYFVVLPNSSIRSENKFSSAIILFHGLNERSWDKYKPWAEYLADNTGKPVILFPISLHINRSPASWSNPRIMQALVNREISGGTKTDNLSFFNYALSKRIVADPFRFYLAGRETIYNVCQLVMEIKSGQNPVFSRDCHFNIFAYSIGALLAQVLLEANPLDMFPDSKLFMFCGGALFSEMNGCSKLIMDNESFIMLNKYYREVFVKENGEKRKKGDEIEKAFISHIGYNTLKDKRESFYCKSKKRIKAISLKKDSVIPTAGIKLALGKIWKECLTEIDFPFNYSHEIPFPAIGKGIDKDERMYWFEKVFCQAALFLC